MGLRYWFFLLSLLVIVPGLIFLILAPGLKPGIDFSGGSTLAIEFAESVDQEQLRYELDKKGHPDARVQKDKGNKHTFFVSTKELRGGEREELVDALELTLSPSGLEILSFDLVSPVVAKETVINALWAVLAAAVGIFFYLWWAFRSVPSPLRYGVAAIVALLHDTFAVLGIFAFLGFVFGTEVNSMFLIALLTVIGYSVNDTIVVFDRLRENTLFYPNQSFSATANLSISETIGRSLNTSMTLLFVLLSMLLFGGPTISNFLWVLLIGVVAGTYSSIAIATQVLVIWEAGEVGRLFKRVLLRRSKTSSSSVSV